MSSKPPGPLHWQTLLSGLIVTILGGIVVAFIVGEGRLLAPQTSGNLPSPSIATDMPGTITSTPINTPISTTNLPLTDTPPLSVLETSTLGCAKYPSSFTVHGIIKLNGQPLEGAPVTLRAGPTCAGRISSRATSWRFGDYAFENAFTQGTFIYSIVFEEYGSFQRVCLPAAVDCRDTETYEHNQEQIK